MSSTPLVSIITPAYDAEPWIAETAASVLSQTFADWEWIVVDDGSTDRTPAIVEALDDPRISLVRSDHTGLPAVGRNIALRQARGTFVAFLDSDDLWLPEKLEMQIGYFDRNPEAGLVFSTAKYLYVEHNRIGRGTHPTMRGVPNPGRLFGLICLENPICNSSAIVRRDLLERAEPLNEDPRQRGSEDYDLWLRLAPLAAFGWLDRPLVIYRVTSSGLSHSAVAQTEGRIMALEKALAAHPDLPLPAELHGRRLEAWKLFWRGYAQLRDGAERSGRPTIWRSLRIHPLNARAWAWFAVSCLGSSWQARMRRLAYRFV